MGMTSNIFTERADAADVEAFGNGFSLVADAKAMRLSRTAKNQKDFKVEAMAKWKYGKPFGIVVSPLYQLPARQSQIYFQATTRDVCLLSYSHLSVLVTLAEAVSKPVAENALKEILESVSQMNPTKDAQAYWQTINKTLLGQDRSVKELWAIEKLANEAAIEYSKTEALTFLAEERERISRLSHAEAIKQLISANNIENRTRVISAVSDNGLITLE
jgi:type II restriction enzyme